MIQMQTILRVLDNSGAKLVYCIRVIKRGAFTNRGRLTDLLVVSVKKLRDKNKFLSKVKKGDIVYAVVIKTRQSFCRKVGYAIKSDVNAVALLSKQLKPIGTRIFSTLPYELRSTRNSKLLSLGNGVV